MMTNVHVSLGGIKREYVEVDRPAEVGDDKSVIDLLANLARRVTELERQIEANTKDIAYLDERTRSTNDDPTFTLTQIIEALGGVRR